MSIPVRGGWIHWMQDCRLGFGRFAAREVGRRVAAPWSAPLPPRRAAGRMAQAELGHLHCGRGALGTGGTRATGCTTPRSRRQKCHSLLQIEVFPSFPNVITLFHAISQAENRGVPLFLLEGGVWRWPTIRVGFSREVLTGVRLRTVAVHPALFDLEFTNDSEGHAMASWVGNGMGWFQVATWSLETVPVILE